MPTYIVKTKMTAQYLVHADSPEEAADNFGMTDPGNVNEKIEVQDEDGNTLLKTSGWKVGY